MRWKDRAEKKYLLRKVKMKIKIIISIILASFALLFIIQNFAVINIRFLFWTLSISSALLMFSLLLIGLILGWSLNSYSMHRSKKIKNWLQDNECRRICNFEW